MMGKRGKRYAAFLLFSAGVLSTAGFARRAELFYPSRADEVIVLETLGQAQDVPRHAAFGEVICLGVCHVGHPLPFWGSLLLYQLLYRNCPQDASGGPKVPRIQKVRGQPAPWCLQSTKGGKNGKNPGF